LGSLDIKCGIFQGDALSPFSFGISLLLVSLLLSKEPICYHLKDGQRNNHLLYVDALELYARISIKFIHCVHIFGMIFVCHLVVISVLEFLLTEESLGS